ncbi:MAG: Nre family DNA repair protein [Candidatus Aenigmatarchaeota archaeon]
MQRKLNFQKIRNPWISFIDNNNVLSELSNINVKITRNFRCVLCRGGKLLCGKTRCPILVRFYAQMKTAPLTDSLRLEGSAPGSIFVGKFGYPYCFVGPLVPPFHGDTRILDTPEFWPGKSIDEIVNFRSQLVRGKYRVNVKNVTQGKIVELTRELALSKIPTDAEVEFTKKPSGKLILDDDVQPFGPSAPLKELRIGNVKTDQRIEKAFSDIDLKATDAVMMLYNKHVLISKIQTAFSAGLLGIEKNRCFVPTKMSITAVDSIISQKLLEEVKTFPLINEFRVYEHFALDNRWVILMIPSNWQYELIEAWYPRTTWNPAGREVVIYSSSEGFEGRKYYAEIGGCYYAARLAVSEYLKREKRQAGVVIFREAHPGYILPVGVWNVRENVRIALKKKPVNFNSLEEALLYVSSKLEIKLKDWIENSDILRKLLYQRKILDYLKI